MNKILLVYEDYADLMTVEATLKKVGFDVIGLSSEYAVAEQMLAFNPDLVVGAGRGGKVSSLGVGKRLKEMNRWQGKSVLIFPANFKPNPQELIRIRVDMILEAPVPPVRLVQVVGKILGHDEAVLLERLNKAMHIETPPKAGVVGTTSGKHTPEGEAIYVKGVIEGREDVEGEGSLHTERIQETPEELALSHENQEQKLSFRFGDRMSEAEAEVQASHNSGSAFPDVDLQSLERELLGGGAPEVERIDVTPPDVEPIRDAEEVPSTSGEASLSEEDLLKARAKDVLERSENGLKERIAKYSEMVAEVKVAPKSTVTRVEARRRLKEMATDWDSQNLTELDKLRRNFTKALFKK